MSIPYAGQYVAMGTVASPNHHLEVDGSVFFKHVNGGQASTEVPVEIFSDYGSANDMGLANSRQLRFRVQVKDALTGTEGPLTGSMAVSDMGVDWTGNYFFITSPAPFYVGDKESFTLDYRGRIGVNTSLARARLDVRDDTPLAWGGDGSMQWAIKSNLTVYSDLTTSYKGMRLVSLPSTAVDVDFEAYNVGDTFITIRESGEVGIGTGATSLFPEAALVVTGPTGVVVNEHTFECTTMDLAVRPSLGTGTLSFGGDGTDRYGEVVTRLTGTWTMNDDAGDRVRVGVSTMEVLPKAADWACTWGSDDYMVEMSTQDDAPPSTSRRLSFKGSLDNNGLEVRDLVFDNWKGLCLGSTQDVSMGPCDAPVHTFGISSPTVALFQQAIPAGDWSVTSGQGSTMLELKYSTSLDKFSISNVTAGSALQVGNDTDYSLRVDPLAMKLARSGESQVEYSHDTNRVWFKTFMSADEDVDSTEWFVSMGKWGRTIFHRVENEELLIGVYTSGQLGDTGRDKGPVRLAASFTYAEGSARILEDLIVGSLSAGPALAQVDVRQASHQTENLLFAQTDGGLPFCVASDSSTGVGVASPEAQLHVQGTTSVGDALLKVVGNTTSVDVQVGRQGYGAPAQDGTFFRVDNAAAQQAIVASFMRSNGTPALVLNDDGAVGVGALLPEAQLHVSVTSGTDALYLEGDHPLQVTAQGALGLGHDPVVGPRAWVDLVAPDTTMDRLWLDGDGTGPTFRVDTEGRLGVGYGAPTARLHVQPASASEVAVLAEDASGVHLHVEGYSAGIGGAPATSTLEVFSKDATKALLAAWDTTASSRMCLVDNGQAAFGYDLTTQAALARFHVEVAAGESLPTFLLQKAGGQQLVVTSTGKLGLGVGMSPSAYVHAKNPLATQPTALFEDMAGTDPVVVQATGRLGVGTLTPSSKLHVKAATGDAQAYVEAAERGWVHIQGNAQDQTVQDTLEQGIVLQNGTHAVRMAQQAGTVWFDTPDMTTVTWTRTAEGSVGLADGCLGLGVEPADDAVLRIVPSATATHTYAVALGPSSVAPLFGVDVSGNITGASLAVSTLETDTVAVAEGGGLVNASGDFVVAYDAAQVHLAHPSAPTPLSGFTVDAGGHAALGSATLPGQAKLVVTNDVAAPLDVQVGDDVCVAQGGLIGMGILTPSSRVHIFKETRQDILGIDTHISDENLTVDADVIRIDYQDIQTAGANLEFAEYSRSGIAFGGQSSFAVGLASISDVGMLAAPSAEFGGAAATPSVVDTIMEVNRADGSTLLAVQADAADATLPGSVLIGHLGTALDRMHVVSVSEDQPGLLVENSTTTPSTLTLRKDGVGSGTLAFDSLGTMLGQSSGSIELRTQDATPSIVVANTGLVGFNTTAPKDVLHVYDGDLRISATRTNDVSEKGFDYTILNTAYHIRNYTIQGGGVGFFANEYLDLVLGNGARVLMGRTHQTYYMTAAGAIKSGTGTGLVACPAWEGTYLGTKLTFVVREGGGWNLVQPAHIEDIASSVDDQNGGVDVLLSSVSVDGIQVQVFDLAAVFPNTFYSGQDFPGGMTKGVTSTEMGASDIAYEFTGGDYTISTDATGLVNGDIVLGYRAQATVQAEYNFVSTTGTQNLRLSQTSGGTLSGGVEFSTGVTVSGDTLVLQVDASTPSQLYLYDPAAPISGFVSVKIELDETLVERHTWVRRTLTDGFTVQSDGTVVDNVSGEYFFKLPGRVGIDWNPGEFAEEVDFHVVTAVYPTPDGVTDQKDLGGGDTARAAIKFMSSAGQDGEEDFGALFFGSQPNGDPKESQFSLLVGSGASAGSDRFLAMEAYCEEIVAVNQETGNREATSTYGVTRVNFPSANIGVGTSNPEFPVHVESYGWIGSQRLAYFVHQATTQLSDPLNPGISDDLGTLSSFIGIHSRFSISTSMALIALSDRRVKHEIRDLDDGESLAIIEALQPKKFKRRDVPGGKIYYGFLAQEVQDVLPHAVYVNQRKDELVRDIQAFVTLESLPDGTCRMQLDAHPGNGPLIVGERIHFAVSSDNVDCHEVYATVTEVDGMSVRFRPDSSISKGATTFCTGRAVDDLRELHESYIFSVNVSATQELIRKNQALEKRVRDLEIAVRELLNR